MLLLLLAFAGGVLTIVSPCILPVLPFVFARADRPFLKSGLPMLVGMAATFALVASLAAVVGGWAVQLNQWGRIAALALLALFGLALLLPSLADRMMRPLAALGGRLTERADKGGAGELWTSLLLGVATGLLWAPCAGPILGLIFTGAAIRGASADTTLLLLSYALGAAASLALALLAGGRVYRLMKRSLGAGAWVRRGLGVLVLIAVVAIALGADTGFLTRVSSARTASLEQGLLDRFGPKPKPRPGTPGKFPPMPPLSGATAWINSPPLTREGLRGRVVVVDFWTYSCINCLRATPHVKAWAERYARDGLTVIGVHTPEFAFEKNRANVEKAVRDLGIAYPVAMDNDYAVWKAYENTGWPTHYFIDAEGRLRDILPGEGQYDKGEAAIRKLLAERNGRAPGAALAGAAPASGAQAAADIEHMLSPETWLGYARIGEKFSSPGGVRKDQAFDYALPKTYAADGWGLKGRWRIGEEAATNLAPGGRIAFRFQSRDLHMVLGPGPDNRPVRFRVTIDGKPPGADHGLDIDAKGEGRVTDQRLYQLIRQKAVKEVDHTFEIEFLDPGVQAYTFTFG